MLSDNSIWKQARDLIANGQTSKSLALLRSHASSLPEEAENELVLFQARLSQLERTERLIGQDVSMERQRLNLGMLDFIRMHETATRPTADRGQGVLGPAQQRLVRLQKKMAEAYDLMEQWEQKQTLAENPNEAKRCALEIKRLGDIIGAYALEIEHLQA